MERRNSMKKILALALSLALSFGLVFASGQEAYAASSGKLVKTVKDYYKDGSKWKLFSKTTYTYNSKKDPVKIVCERPGQVHEVTTIKYTYKNGKKTQAKHYFESDYQARYLDSVVTYDSKGRAKTATYYDPEYPDDILSAQTYVYGKNGYIKKIKDEYGDDYVIEYSWNKKKPKTIKCWLVSDGSKVKTTYVSFNKKGFIKKQKKYDEGDNTYTYKYKYKNGRVSTIELEAQGGDDFLWKHVITYTKKSISDSRYRAMINGIVEAWPQLRGTFWF